MRFVHICQKKKMSHKIARVSWPCFTVYRIQLVINIFFAYLFASQISFLGSIDGQLLLLLLKIFRNGSSFQVRVGRLLLKKPFTHSLYNHITNLKFYAFNDNRSWLPNDCHKSPTSPAHLTIFQIKYSRKIIMEHSNGLNIYTCRCHSDLCDPVKRCYSSEKSTSHVSDKVPRPPTGSVPATSTRDFIRRRFFKI